MSSPSRRMSPPTAGRLGGDCLGQFEEIPGPDRFSIFLQCATPTGLDYPSREPPCPTGFWRRCLGLPLSRYGQPPSATATRKTPQEDPGHQLEGPSQALQTLPITGGTR